MQTQTPINQNIFLEIKSLLRESDVSSCAIIPYPFEKESQKRILQDDLKSYQKWLDQDLQATMNYMKDSLFVRKDPEKVLPGISSIAICLFSYHSSEPAQGFQKLVARYAHVKDYHKIIKKQLQKIVDEVCAQNKIPPSAFRIVVDSVPFLERAFARQSGLGFVGKNTMLIRPTLGSYFFIASILSTIPIQEPLFSEGFPSAEMNANLDCGDCRRCIEACPTNALKEYQLDANKCLSYLTIEHRDLVEKKFLPHFEKHIFGCDICQDVCPYNKNAIINTKWTTQNFAFQLQSLNVEEIAKMNFIQYQEWFGGTSLTRAKYAGLVRNALYHLYAIKHPQVLVILEQRKSDEDNFIQRIVHQLLQMVSASSVSNTE